MKRRIVAITGLSGVGKSTLMTKLGASIPLEHLQASTLIKEGRHAGGHTSLTQDQLRFSDIDENQNFLVKGFRMKTGTRAGLFILDGHTVVERDDGLIRIDPRVFGAIGITCMIFLVDAPEAIAKRRLDDARRKRPVPHVDSLRLIQEEADAHAVTICRALSIPLHRFRVDEVALIAQTVQP